MPATATKATHAVPHGVHGEQQQRHARREEVGSHHQRPAVQPVRQHSAVRRDQGEGEGVNGEHQAAEEAAAGQRREQRHERHQREPVAGQADQRAKIDAAEVGLPAQQVHCGPHYPRPFSPTPSPE
ncbi:MAG: hypothetical protein ACR2J0_01715 [Mycobacteriales bacterium]